MRSFAAGFDDGHVQLGLTETGCFPTRWPGFLTIYRGADPVVAAGSAVAEADEPQAVAL